MAPPLVVPALKKHTATVIMAHGLGDSGAGWISLAQNWRRRGKFEEVKFIFPNAPKIPITVNGGYPTSGWYDISDFTDLAQRGEDKQGIVKSRDYFADIISKEASSTSVPTSRMILGGFSQGGAMSLFTGLTISTRLGGVFGLSSYLLLFQSIEELCKDNKGANLQTPFFMGHGDADPLVKHEWGVRSADHIKQMGYQLDFKTYRGLEHSAAVEEIDDLEAFINKVLKDQPAATGDSSSSSATKTDIGNPGL